MSQATAESFAAMIEAGMSGIAYLAGILQYPAIWYRIYKYGADGISVPSQLLLALSYLTLYFLPLLGPHPSFLPYIPSLAFAFFFIPFPLYTLYLLHTRSRAIFPYTLPSSEKSQCYTISAICLGLALIFNYEWFLWGGRWGESGGGRRGTGAWGVGWLYEILWAFGTYLGAVGVWPQLAEYEREGRAELMRDRWLMCYLGLLYLSAGMTVLRSCLGAVNIHWDPLAFYASLFTTVLFTYYLIKIFVFRSTSPAFSLPSFTSSSSSPSGRGRSWSARNWSWPWRRSEYVALSGEEEPLYDGHGEDSEEQDRIRASSAAAAAQARLAAERARGALSGE